MHIIGFFFRASVGGQKNTIIVRGIMLNSLPHLFLAAVFASWCWLAAVAFFFWLLKKCKCCKVRWAKTMTKKVRALLPSVIALWRGLGGTRFQQQ
jgi:uncharacterized membrane protein YeiH